jgi:hypothetical protein
VVQAEVHRQYLGLAAVDEPEAAGVRVPQQEHALVVRQHPQPSAVDRLG